ncbi:unnamed protein product [Linum trigynum]|uniref:Uncharacterized protein n=1 Tax=Linum trigynum TaxID=586398 RepID=A0AAV2CUQ4_9ROSI
MEWSSPSSPAVEPINFGRSLIVPSVQELGEEEADGHGVAVAVVTGSRTSQLREITHRAQSSRTGKGMQ